MILESSTQTEKRLLWQEFNNDTLSITQKDAESLSVMISIYSEARSINFSTEYTKARNCFNLLKQFRAVILCKIFGIRPANDIAHNASDFVGSLWNILYDPLPQQAVAAPAQHGHNDLGGSIVYMGKLFFIFPQFPELTVEFIQSFHHIRIGIVVRNNQETTSLLYLVVSIFMYEKCSQF